MLGSFAGVADYGAFVIAIVVFLAIPGPGNLALITSTGKGGIAGGMGATFGVIAGDQVLLWAAVAGVSALMAAYPTAFHLVQWLGAAYLAWLGAKMLLAKPGDDRSRIEGYFFSSAKRARRFERIRNVGAQRPTKIPKSSPCVRASNDTAFPPA